MGPPLLSRDEISLPLIKQEFLKEGRWGIE